MKEKDETIYKIHTKKKTQSTIQNLIILVQIINNSKFFVILNLFLLKKKTLPSEIFAKIAKNIYDNIVQY